MLKSQHDVPTTTIMIMINAEADENKDKDKDKDARDDAYRDVAAEKKWYVARKWMFTAQRR